MTKEPSQRLNSLDALRGFDMFWIVGGAGIFIHLSRLTGWSALQVIEKQLYHVPWDGFAFFDMIFPLFLFMAGVSLPFSMKKYMNGASKSTAYTKIIKRGVLLVLFGLIYNGLLSFDFENMRYASVLGRIGLAWMFAALIFINTEKTRTRVLWCFGLMLFYWLLNICLKAPDYPDAGRFTPQGNIACYIDRILLPGKLHNKIYDPEGILGIIPAISTALLGALTGLFVSQNKKELSPKKKAGYMAIAGALLVGVAQLWNLVYPINKSLWSSSFVCMAGGLSVLLFALFYLIIDVYGYNRPFFFFKVIGMNSITVYMAIQIVSFSQIRNFFLSGVVSLFPETWHPFINSVAYVAVVWIFLLFLYRKKIFLKV